MGRNKSEARAGLESSNADADPPVIWGRPHAWGSMCGSRLPIRSRTIPRAGDANTVWLSGRGGSAGATCRLLMMISVDPAAVSYDRGSRSCSPRSVNAGSAPFCRSRPPDWRVMVVIRYLFLEELSCAQRATTRMSNTTIHSNEKHGPRQNHHSSAKFGWGKVGVQIVRGRYETSFTSQSVQPKPRAGPGRQPASDAVNTRLL